MQKKRTVGSERPIIGLAALIVKDGKVLLGKRKGAHGAGTYAPPGGKLEMNEELEACVAREVKEETGMSVRVGRLAAVTNNVFKDEKVHTVTLYFLCKVRSGKPRLMEPEKCEGWDWYSWRQLPKPLFLAIRRLVEQGFDPTKG